MCIKNSQNLSHRACGICNLLFKEATILDMQFMQLFTECLDKQRQIHIMQPLAWYVLSYIILTS